MLLAFVASLRSEDPYLKVGAVALTEQKRVIATAYNGLKSGMSVPPSFWDDREARLPHVLHAENNLCALFTYGQAHTVAVTTLPCRACATALISHGVKRVIYGAEYARDSSAKDIFKFSGIELVHVDLTSLLSRLSNLCQHITNTPLPKKSRSRRR